jgi:hypothetical protein
MGHHTSYLHRGGGGSLPEKTIPLPAPVLSTECSATHPKFDWTWPHADPLFWWLYKREPPGEWVPIGDREGAVRTWTEPGVNCPGELHWEFRLIGLGEDYIPVTDWSNVTQLDVYVPE